MNVRIPVVPGAENSRTGAGPSSRNHREGSAERLGITAERAKEERNKSIADPKAEQELCFFIREREQFFFRFFRTAADKSDSPIAQSGIEIIVPHESDSRDSRIGSGDGQPDIHIKITAGHQPGKEGTGFIQAVCRYGVETQAGSEQGEPGRIRISLPLPGGPDRRLKKI